MAMAAMAVFLTLGLWGLLDLLIRWAAERWHRRRGRRTWGGRGRPPIPTIRAARIPPAVLGGGAGMAVAVLLQAAGMGGIWPGVIVGMGIGGGALIDVIRRWEAEIRLRAAEVALLEEMALMIAARGSLEAAARAVAAAAGIGEADRRLREALRAALDGAIARGGGGLEAVEAWARAVDPDRLLPVAAAVRAAAAGGERPEEAFMRTADDAAAETWTELAARLRALPDRLLPLVGLGIFAPILGMVALPIAAYLFRLITATPLRGGFP